MKLGVFGGTFDPVHTGHLILAQECWHQLSLDRVMFVPAHISPFKKGCDTAGAADRLNMLRLAIGSDSRFGISTLELDKGGVSYTIDTVKFFAEKYGAGTELFFLAGADAAEGAPEWKDIEGILDIACFVTVTRPGYQASSLNGRENVRSVKMPLVDISSEMVRGRVKNRQPIDYIVPRVVVEYIRNKGLYRD